MSVKSTTKKSPARRKTTKGTTNRKADVADAQIDALIARDPDWAETEPIDWSKAEVVVPPKKQAISIRLDQDLIDFFKAEGAGYQRRINAVLRGYVRDRIRR